MARSRVRAKMINTNAFRQCTSARSASEKNINTVLGAEALYKLARIATHS